MCVLGGGGRICWRWTCFSWEWKRCRRHFMMQFLLIFLKRKHLHKYPAQTKIQYRGLQHFYLQHGRWKIWSLEFECSTDIGMSSDQTFQPPRWSKLTEPTLVKRASKSMLQHESSRFFKPSKFLWWHSQPGGTADFSNDQ